MQEVYILPLKKFTAFIPIIRKVKHTLYEEIIVNEVRLGGKPPIKGTLSVVANLLLS